MSETIDELVELKIEKSSEIVLFVERINKPIGMELIFNKGDRGDQGPKGDTGDQGGVGETGPQGIQGIKGDKGDKGDTGDQGPIGSQGIQGQGFKISKIYSSIAELLADTAPTGILAGEFAVINSVIEPDSGQLYLWDGTNYSFMVDLSGTQGVQGIQGPQGSQGVQGIQGPKGDTGNTGATGAQGPAGTTDHTLLTNIGTKTHAQLEADIATNATAIATKMRDIGDTYNKLFIDFIGLADHNIFVTSVSGGTATNQITGVNAAESVFGCLRLTASTVNQYAGGRIGNSSGMCPLHMGNGSSTTVALSARWTYTSNLPDATDTTKTYFGFVDDATGGGVNEPAHFIGFRYDPTVNSGKFQAVIRTSSVDGEAVNLNFTPSINVNDVYKVVVETTGVAKFYINGILVHTSTTTLPVPTQLLGAHIKMLKTAGVASRLLTLDWMMLEYSRVAER